MKEDMKYTEETYMKETYTRSETYTRRKTYIKETYTCISSEGYYRKQTSE